MRTTRCGSCPQTASVECMKTCPRTAVQTRDRNLQVRLLLEMNPERCSMLTAGAPFKKKPGSQQASWQTPVQW